MSIPGIIIGIILSAILMAGAYIGLNNVLSNGKATNGFNEFDKLVKAVIAYKANSPKIGTFAGIDTEKLDYQVVNSDSGNTGQVLQAGDSGADNDGDGTNDGEVTLNNVNGGTTFNKIVKVKEDGTEGNVNMKEYVYAFESIPGVFAQVENEGSDDFAIVHIEQGYTDAAGEPYVSQDVRKKLESKISSFVAGKPNSKVINGSSIIDGVVTVKLSDKDF